jgi:hypothetical protein
MRGISARKARKLRALVTRRITAQRNLAAYRLGRAKRDAAERVATLKDRLSPEYRLRQSQALAQWEAHVDALEDDGGYAIPKGSE